MLIILDTIGFFIIIIQIIISIITMKQYIKNNYSFKKTLIIIVGMTFIMYGLLSIIGIIIKYFGL